MERRLAAILAADVVAYRRMRSTLRTRAPMSSGASRGRTVGGVRVAILYSRLAHGG